jgi:hypothetical protein
MRTGFAREADAILCPYCATRFRFDPRLTPLDADPPDSFFAEGPRLADGITQGEAAPDEFRKAAF